MIVQTPPCNSKTLINGQVLKDYVRYKRVLLRFILIKYINVKNIFASLTAVSFVLMRFIQVCIKGGMSHIVEY